MGETQLRMAKKINKMSTETSKKLTAFDSKLSQDYMDEESVKDLLNQTTEDD